MGLCPNDSSVSFHYLEFQDVGVVRGFQFLGAPSHPVCEAPLDGL